MPTRFSLLVVLQWSTSTCEHRARVPVLPQLIEEFEGGDVSRASYIYGALAETLVSVAVQS